MATMPISTMNRLATNTGAGQRTTAVPTLRQNRLWGGRLDSYRPARLPRYNTAGPSVTAMATTTTMPIATGAPMVAKYGSRVKLRQYVAPAIVRPDPTMTGATDVNVA